MKHALVTAFFMIPTLSFAQSFPDHPSLYVNDHADLLTDDAETHLTRRLKRLKSETGVEATILTIDSHTIYGHTGSMERFATTLFNEWGIGGAQSNNGILILIERDERAMRIELGRGYDAGYDRLAQRVIVQDFLPAFKQSDYQRGIEAGTAAVITQIAEPFAAGKPARKPQGGIAGSPIWIFVTVFGAVLLSFKGAITDMAAPFRACSSCGNKTLSRQRHVHRVATPTLNGERQVTTRCSSCDYIDRLTSPITYTHIRMGGGRGGSFGGGGSSGGGGSGRW